jgi:ABC-type transport system involved in multi-copper enzyme maturation permease subunit
MSHPALTIARYTFLEGLRTRLFWVSALALLLLYGASILVQQLAIADSTRIQTGFLATALRLAVIFLLSLHVISSMLREFNDKGFELILSLDLARASYVLGKFGGYAMTGLLLTLFATALVMTVAPTEQTILWGASLACELWLVTAFSLFCAMYFTQTLSAASAMLGFYLLARSVSAIQLISGSTLFDAADSAHRFLAGAVDALALALPRLDTFTQTAWLVNGSGSWGALMALGTQTAIYVVLLLAATMFDLYRKNL